MVIWKQHPKGITCLEWHCHLQYTDFLSNWSGKTRLGPLDVIFGRSWIWLFICWQISDIYWRHSSLTRCIWKIHQTNRNLDICLSFQLMWQHTIPFQFLENDKHDISINFSIEHLLNMTKNLIVHFLLSLRVDGLCMCLDYVSFFNLALLPHFNSTTKLRLNSNTSSSLTTVTYVYTILPQRGLKSMLTAQILCAWRNLQLVYETNNLIC